MCVCVSIFVVSDVVLGVRSSFLVRELIQYDCSLESGLLIGSCSLFLEITQLIFCCVLLEIIGKIM